MEGSCAGQKHHPRQTVKVAFCWWGIWKGKEEELLASRLAACNIVGRTAGVQPHEGDRPDASDTPPNHYHALLQYDGGPYTTQLSGYDKLTSRAY